MYRVRKRKMMNALWTGQLVTPNIEFWPHHITKHCQLFLMAQIHLVMWRTCLVSITEQYIVGTTIYEDGNTCWLCSTPSHLYTTDAMHYIILKLQYCAHISHYYKTNAECCGRHYFLFQTKIASSNIWHKYTSLILLSTWILSTTKNTFISASRKFSYLTMLKAKIYCTIVRFFRLSQGSTASKHLTQSNLIIKYGTLNSFGYRCLWLLSKMW